MFASLFCSVSVCNANITRDDLIKAGELLKNGNYVQDANNKEFITAIRLISWVDGYIVGDNMSAYRIDGSSYYIKSVDPKQVIISAAEMASKDPSLTVRQAMMTQMLGPHVEMARRYFEIGKIKIVNGDNSFIVKTLNGDIEFDLNKHRVFIANYYVPEYSGVDGILVENDILKLVKEPLTPLLIPRFSFFNATKKTAFAIVRSTRGASGGSSQEMYIFDSSTGKHVLISTSDMNPPCWIFSKESRIAGRAPSIVEGVSLYLGPRVAMKGAGVYYKKVYNLDGGEKVFDKELTEKFLNGIYSRSKKSFGKLEYVSSPLSMMDNKTAKTILMFYYYSKVLGHMNDVELVLSRVHSSVRDELLLY